MTTAAVVHGQLEECKKSGVKTTNKVSTASAAVAVRVQKKCKPRWMTCQTLGSSEAQVLRTTRRIPFQGIKYG